MDTERQDWARGYAALRRYTEREHHARVPYGHREAPGPHHLGQWVAEQRRAYRAEQLDGKRAEQLEQLGMVWDTTDAAFQENLAAARVYYEQHCSPPRNWRSSPASGWSGRRRRGRSAVTTRAEPLGRDGSGTPRLGTPPQSARTRARSCAGPGARWGALAY
ncbi:helicase associated domain-containing protein [Streptomyces hygroscopicus]|uniref:helicase associated domain-containing protein n=1 Tax=Streptomyces hygroscopicus TaxID=1912 RepID=UPI003A0FCE29